MKGFVALTVAALLALGATAVALTPPPTLNGLKMSREEITLSKTKRKEYLERIELFSLRHGKQLEATLQVGRFRRDAPIGRASFRRTIAGEVGTSVPVEQRIAGTTVYLTRARKLAVAVWFRGRELRVLSIRTDYDTPKSLIRAAVVLSG
jgi:hypothetical protein